MYGFESNMDTIKFSTHNTDLKYFFGHYPRFELERKTIKLTTTFTSINRTFQCEIYKFNSHDEWLDGMDRTITHLQKIYNNKLEGNKI